MGSLNFSADKRQITLQFPLVWYRVSFGDFPSLAQVGRRGKAGKHSWFCDDRNQFKKKGGANASLFNIRHQIIG
jgi:hypothetical protein